MTIKWFLSLLAVLRCKRSNALRSSACKFKFENSTSVRNFEGIQRTCRFDWYPAVKMVVEVEKAVDIYRDLAQIPSAVSGQISLGINGIHRVTSVWNQRDLERSEKVASRRFDTVKVGGEKVELLATTHQYEFANEIYNAPSPSGDRTAIVRKIKNKKGDEKMFIEIWRGESKCTNIDIEAADKHGKIYNSDAQFGVLRWSYGSDKLVYIAEKKETKAKSWFEPKKTEAGGSKPEETRVGEEFLYKEDWGELLVEKYYPVICVLDVLTEEITVVDTSPELSPGTPVWTPDDSGLVYAAWDHEPYKLGLIYCPMRKSGIYHHDLNTKITVKLSADDVGVMSPVTSPDGSHVFWIQTMEGGPHMQTCRLMKAPLIPGTGGAVTCVVDIVNEYSPAKQAGQFPGWYQIRLPDRCWTRDGRLVLDNPWRFNTEVITLDVDTGKVTKLTTEDGSYCYSVLDVYGDYILASRSTPVHSSHLVLGHVNKNQVKWTRLTAGRIFPEMEYKLQVHTLAPERLSSEYPSVTEFESLLLTPVGLSTSDKIPLILHPHGGPHSRFTAQFMYFAAGFVQCGFAVVMVNFRASTGYGQDFLWSLPGHVGDMDVKDCMQALTETLALGVYDDTRLCVTGGSHGGLLTGNLVGQYPDTFKAAIARNPVMNMTSMYHGTDIPDWLQTELLGRDKMKVDLTYIPTPEDYNKFYLASPLRYVDKVKTPVMLMLGVVDRRVPCNQGEEYYRHLKARGVPTRIHRYPESSHPLQEVNVEADNFVNMVQWFTKFI